MLERERKKRQAIEEAVWWHAASGRVIVIGQEASTRGHEPFFLTCDRRGHRPIAIMEYPRCQVFTSSS